jgi:hypothetical protein
MLKTSDLPPLLNYRESEISFLLRKSVNGFGKAFASTPKDLAISTVGSVGQPSRTLSEKTPIFEISTRPHRPLFARRRFAVSIIFC